MYVLQIDGLNREICVDNKNFETFIKYVYAQETAWNQKLYNYHVENDNLLLKCTMS